MLRKKLRYNFGHKKMRENLKPKSDLNLRRVAKTRH